MTSPVETGFDDQPVGVRWPYASDDTTSGRVAGLLADVAVPRIICAVTMSTVGRMTAARAEACANPAAPAAPTSKPPRIDSDLAEWRTGRPWAREIATEVSVPVRNVVESPETR